MRFLLIWQKIFTSKFPGTIFTGNSGNHYLLENDLDTLYRYCLLQETEESLCTYLDMSHALARRILSCRDQYETFSQFANLLKTKEITRTRIQRALLHMLLHIQSVPAQIPYARVLGFRKNSSALLGKIKKCGSIPLLTRLPEKPVVSGSGMAGYGSANLIKTEKRFGHVYLCGDGTSDVADGLGLMAPRVAVCSAHEGTMVLRLLIGETEP